MIKYEFLEHPADLKIRSFGHDLPELFINSALAMMDFLYETVDVKSIHTEVVQIDGCDLESLFVNWLAEILYLSDTQHRIFVNFEIIELTDTSLTAELGSGKGIAIDDIKAVTYHDLSITKFKDHWSAIVVYDV